MKTKPGKHTVVAASSTGAALAGRSTYGNTAERLVRQSAPAPEGARDRAETIGRPPAARGLQGHK